MDRESGKNTIKMRGTKPEKLYMIVKTTGENDLWLATRVSHAKCVFCVNCMLELKWLNDEQQTAHN